MMSKYAFGVDVGGTTVKLGLFTVERKFCRISQHPSKTKCRKRTSPQQTW